MTTTDTPTATVANVVRAFRSATVADLSEGTDWYRRAHALAVELDPRCPRRAAAVLAVLSPMMSWKRNAELARQAYYLAGTTTNRAAIADGLACLKGNAVKAARILTGDDPDAVVSGPKVRAFWLAICDPSNAEAIVVDRHAVDVAVGRVTDDETRGKLLAGRRRYGQVAECYRQAAVKLSALLGRTITPVEVQAVTWVYWRRTHAAHRKAVSAGKLG